MGIDDDQLPQEDEDESDDSDGDQVVYQLDEVDIAQEDDM